MAKSSRPAASRRGSESGSDQASYNNYQPAGSWLGIDMRCSSDQGEGRSLQGLLRQFPTDEADTREGSLWGLGVLFVTVTFGRVGMILQP